MQVESDKHKIIHVLTELSLKKVCLPTNIIVFPTGYILTTAKTFGICLNINKEYNVRDSLNVCQ